MRRDDTPAYYRTRDLPEAAAILTLGHPLKDLEDGPGHKLFVFSYKAQDIAARYWAGKLRLEPRVYSLSMRALRDRIFLKR